MLKFQVLFHNWFGLKRVAIEMGNTINWVELKAWRRMEIILEDEAF